MESYVWLEISFGNRHRRNILNIKMMPLMTVLNGLTKKLENKTMDKNINEILCQIANKEDQTPYIIKNVEDGLKKRDEEITRLREENKRLRDEAYKDSELQMMQKQKFQADLSVAVLTVCQTLQVQSLIRYRILMKSIKRMVSYGLWSHAT